MMLYESWRVDPATRLEAGSSADAFVGARWAVAFSFDWRAVCGRAKRRTARSTQLRAAL